MLFSFSGAHVTAAQARLSPPPPQGKVSSTSGKLQTASIETGSNRKCFKESCLPFQFPARHAWPVKLSTQTNFKDDARKKEMDFFIYLQRIPDSPNPEKKPNPFFCHCRRLTLDLHLFSSSCLLGGPCEFSFLLIGLSLTLFSEDVSSSLTELSDFLPFPPSRYASANPAPPPSPQEEEEEEEQQRPVFVVLQ